MEKAKITLSLEEYKAMEEELKSLRRQVKQKTIYVKILPPIYGWLSIAILLFIWVRFIIFK